MTREDIRFLRYYADRSEYMDMQARNALRCIEQNRPNSARMHAASAYSAAKKIHSYLRSVS